MLNNEATFDLGYVPQMCEEKHCGVSSHRNHQLIMFWKSKDGGFDRHPCAKRMIACDT